MAKNNNYHGKQVNAKNKEGASSMRDTHNEDPKRSGSRPNNRGGRRNQRTDDKRSSVHNSPDWYRAYPSLVAAAANLAFSNPLGKLTDGLGAEGIITGNNGTAYSQAVPGIMTFSTVDTPGVSREGSSALNVLAHQLYTTVRYANSGKANYDSSDLMLYVLAVDSLYSFWAHACRAYSVMQTYTYSNRYFAEKITNALGFNFGTFSGNLARFHGAINELAVKMGSLVIPNNMSYVKRHVWMYSNIFADSPSSKAQLYAYKPKWYWTYDEVYNEQGGAVVRCGSAFYHSLDLWIQDANKLVNNIIASQSLMLMGGDIRKAYGVENLQKIAEIPQVMSASIVYDERTCSEFQNLIVVGTPEADTQVIQAVAGTNTVIFNPKWKKETTGGVATPAPNKLFLNIRNIDDPTPDDVMKATRMMAFLVPDPETNGEYFILDSCGSEICTNCTIHSLASSDGVTMATIQTEVDSYELDGFQEPDLPNSVGLLRRLMQLEKFDWHPYVYVFRHQEGKSYFCDIAGDLDNYTMIDAISLRKIHQAAIYSELFNPQMGTFVRA